MINYNTLFGTFKTDTSIGVTAAVKMDDGGVKDFVFRETNLLRDIKHISRSTSALADPESYLNQKNEDLKKIGSELTTIFSEAFNEYMVRGFTQKEATVRALEIANEEKRKKMIIHLEQFPTRIRDTALRELKETGEKK